MSEPESPATTPDQEFIRSVWEEARDLIKRLEGSTVQRLSVEAGGTKIEIERGGLVAAPAAGAGSPAAPVSIGIAPVAPAAAAAAEDGAPADAGHPILAPLVGTFYRAAQPGAKPFVEEGDVVDEGQTVAIVEAMKLMNQVKADRSGRVASIACSDGEWVEFEQPIMYLEPLDE
jgi:acetyl-CoA carboxylase biotin carboxyl carrier protein